MRTAAHDGPVMVHSGDVVLDGYMTRPADPTACVIVTSLGCDLCVSAVSVVPLPTRLCVPG